MDDFEARLQAIEQAVAYLLSNDKPEVIQGILEDDIPRYQYMRPTPDWVRHYERLFIRAKEMQASVGDASD